MFQTEGNVQNMLSLRTVSRRERKSNKTNLKTHEIMSHVHSYSRLSWHGVICNKRKYTEKPSTPADFDCCYLRVCECCKCIRISCHLHAILVIVGCRCISTVSALSASSTESKAYLCSFLLFHLWYSDTPVVVFILISLHVV